MERTLSKKESRFVVDDIKEINEDERSIVHWVSTESVDRQGDIVRSKGMDDEDYSKNPIVLYGHNYGGFPIGKSLWRRKSERKGTKGILAKTQFAPTPEGQQVFELWKGGYLNAASIGFKPVETEPLINDEGKWTGYDIKKWKLWEYSIVPVPANQDAVRLAIEKGLLRESKVTEPLYRHYLESRVCELESCRDKMAPVQDVIAEMKARLDAIPNYGVVIEKLLERLEKLETRPAETVGRRLTQEDLSVLGAKIAAGAVSQLKGKLNQSQHAVRK